MKIRRIIVAVSLLAIIDGVALQAQQDRPRLTFDQILKREDANQDGKVATEEFKGPTRLFERLDRNDDDVLTKEDFARQREQTGPSNRRGAAPEDVEVLREVVFGQGGGRDLTMHIVIPKEKPQEPAPAFVWIHGGGWRNGSKEGGIRTVAPLVQKGFVGASIEYRLTGEAPFPAQIEDCKCAIRYLRAHAKKYNIDPQRIAVGGSSAGGHLVALLGTSGGVKELEGDGGWSDQSSDVQAVLDLYGPTDFALFVTTKGYEGHNQDGSPESSLLGGGEVLPQAEEIKRVNPITYVDKDDPPFLIIHGGDDPTVPPNQSETLHAALQKANVPSKLLILDGARHGGPEFSEPSVRKMREDFLLQLLDHKKSSKHTEAAPPTAPDRHGAEE